MSAAIPGGCDVLANAQKPGKAGLWLEKPGFLEKPRFLTGRDTMPIRRLHMAYDVSLAARIRKKFVGKKGADEKEMFGAIGFLLHGNMCVGVWKQQLIVRLDAEDGQVAVLEPHVHPFDITGKPMKGWLLIDPA